MTSKNPGPKVYTPEEMKEMWPQAAGELRGWANSLASRQMGITAAQLRMAIQMAEAYWKSMFGDPSPPLEHEKMVGPEVPHIESLPGEHC